MSYKIVIADDEIHIRLLLNKHLKNSQRLVTCRS